MIIKAFLIVSVILVMTYVARSNATGRHLAIRRLAGVAFSLVWVVAVVAPDTVTQLAHLVGVGRGTDLVLYVLVVAYLLTAITQRQSLNDLNDRIGRLTREIALMTSAPGSQTSDTHPDGDD